jgi:hypothetical protein
LFQSLSDSLDKLKHDFEFQQRQAELQQRQAELQRRDAALVQRELVSKIDSAQRELALAQRESAMKMETMQHRSDAEMEKMQREMQSQSDISASKIRSLEQQIVQQSSKMETMERDLRISLRRDMASQIMDLERHFTLDSRSNADMYTQFARGMVQRNSILHEQAECLTNQLNRKSSLVQFLLQAEARLNEDREHEILSNQQRVSLKRKLDALGPVPSVPDFHRVPFPAVEAVMQQEMSHQGSTTGSIIGRLPVRLPNIDPAAIHVQVMAESLGQEQQHQSSSVDQHDQQQDQQEQSEDHEQQEQQGQ